MLDEFLIKVHPIWQDHPANGVRVLVVAMSLDHDFFSKDEDRGGLLRFLAVGLALLRAVDAIEADASRALVVEDFEGVAAEDGDGEFSERGVRKKKEDETCQ